LVDEEADAVPHEAHRFPAQLAEPVRYAPVDVRPARSVPDRLEDDVAAADDVRPDLLGARGRLADHGRAADTGVVAAQHAEHLEPDEIAPPQLARRRADIRELAALAAAKDQ